MARGRVHLPDGSKNLLASDWERVLGQAMLGREDREIGRMYILERMPQIDIAEGRCGGVATQRAFDGLPAHG